MTISFYKGFTRNLEIRNTPVWVLPNIERMRRIKDIRFRISLIKCYWKLQNIRNTAFTVSELWMGNQQVEGGGGLSPSPLGVNYPSHSIGFLSFYCFSFSCVKSVQDDVANFSDFLLQKVNRFISKATLCRFWLISFFSLYPTQLSGSIKIEK